jgi:magnesium transporter
MPRLIKRSRKKVGLSPGTLIHVGDQKIENVKISLINYDQGQLLEKELTSIEDAFPHKDTPPVTWINVDGLHDIDIIEKIGRYFGIHPLTLEDIVNTGHRPKAEDFEDYDYIVLKMLTYDEDQNHITAEQVSFILGPHYLVMKAEHLHLRILNHHPDESV